MSFFRKGTEEFLEAEFKELDEWSDEDLERLRDKGAEAHRRGIARNVLNARTPRTRRSEDS